MSNLHDIRLNPIKIMARGEDHTLMLDMNTFAEIQDKYETKNGLMGFLEDIQKLNIKAIRLLVWAALVDEIPDLTEKEAGKVISLYNIWDVFGSLLDLLNGIGDALPDVADAIKNLIPSQTPTVLKAK